MAMERMSPRRTRSGLVIPDRQEPEEEGLALSPVLERRHRIILLMSPPMSPILRLRMPPQSPEIVRGNVAGGAVVRGMREVGIPDESGGGEVVAEVIDLSDDTDTLDSGTSQPVSPIGAAFRLNESGVEANNNQITPRPRFMVDTIDLTESPTISPIASSIRNSGNQSCPTVPSPSPSITTITCPVCMESIKTITKKGYQVFSTVCGHVFCSHCLLECIKRNTRCPTCRRVLSTRDYHQLFLQ